MMSLKRATFDRYFPAEISLVISNIEDAPGLAWAQSMNTPCQVIPHKPHGKLRQAHEEQIDACLRQHDIQLVCLAGYMRVLTPWLCEQWQGRMLNIHPSLLPSFRGLHTHERALEAGVKYHGCTVHLVSAELDGGPILEQAVVKVEPHDTALSLAARVLQEEHRIYPQVLARLARQQQQGQT